MPFLTEPDVAQQLFLDRTKFGRRNWSANWSAWIVLADFARTNWRSSIVLPAIPTVAQTAAEIEKLKTMALDERPDALGEISAQAREFMSYFLATLGASRSSHPATFRLLSIANLVATMAAMHFKYKYDRPRPSQLCPALLPPLKMPGHASYPSGHSTQAHLFALCGKAILPGAQQAKMGIVLEALAARIARNREIAGLHYPSDSAAGATLATAVFGILSDETKMPHAPNKPSSFANALAKARAEWA